MSGRRSTSARSSRGRTRGNLAELREARSANKTDLYRRRRIMAVSLLLLGALALVLAVLVQTRASGATERAVPIDPTDAGPDTVLAEAAGVGISTPIRPEALTGIGYHPEGETLVELAPRGENLSAGPLLGMFSRGETPEKIHYNVMDAAGRDGPRTGALDVGAAAGTTVYAPVTGVVTAIRPDPLITNANVVEIKPDADPNARVSVSLVRTEEGSGAGVDDPRDRRDDQARASSPTRPASSTRNSLPTPTTRATTSPSP